MSYLLNMRNLLCVTTVVFTILSAVQFLTLSWLIYMHKRVGKKMDKNDKSNITSAVVVCLLVGIVSGSLLLFQDAIIEKKIKNATEGLTEITSYYDYANNKLITTDNLDEMYDDKCERTIYISDSGEVYIIAVNTESIFMPEVTKTDVQTSKTTTIEEVINRTAFTITIIVFGVIVEIVGFKYLSYLEKKHKQEEANMKDENKFPVFGA